VHLHVCATEGVFVPTADGAGCDASPAFLPARPINQADLAALTERVRRRVIRWFRMQRLLDAAARTAGSLASGVFAPNHKLRRAVTALAIGNIGKRREATTGGHAAGGQPTEGCRDTQAKPRSHDTSRIAWAKLMAWLGQEFPLECPNCGGDIRVRGDRRQEPAHAK
jgi:hypothetical protein